VSANVTRWPPTKTVLRIHEEQIRDHGGGSGVRDAGLLESAIARPQNLAAYGEPDLADLAAAYAFGIARNHPFVDGNKRTAFVTAGAFLVRNGAFLDVAEAEAAVVFTDLAAGRLTEAELAAWYRRHLAEG
jgi:death-on-curing protein